MTIASVLWLLSGVGLIYNLLTMNIDNSMVFAGIHIGAKMAFQIIEAHQNTNTNG